MDGFVVAAVYVGAGELDDLLVESINGGRASCGSVQALLHGFALHGVSLGRAQTFPAAAGAGQGRQSQGRYHNYCQESLHGLISIGIESLRRGSI